jgi:hypothetical protein
LWRFLFKSDLPRRTSSAGKTAILTKKVERVVFVDPATGQRQVFNSLVEVPADIRAKFEEARKQGELTSEQALFRFRGADGQEHTYHSLEEMPPDVRAFYEEWVLPEIRAELPGLAEAMQPLDQPPSSSRLLPLKDDQDVSAAWR